MSSAITSSSVKNQIDFNFNIGDQIGRAWKIVTYHYYAITGSHYYDALNDFLKGVKKLHYVAELLFDEYFPEAELTGFQKSVIDNTLFVLLGAAEVAGKFRSFVNFKKVLELPGEIKEALDKKRKADKSRDDKLIFIANLKIASVVEAIFDTPEKIYKFVGLFWDSIPPIFKQITTPCNVVSLILSLVTTISKGHDCYETTQWADKFESKRLRAFIKEYSTKGLTPVPSEIEQKHFSVAKLRKYVNQIESEYADPEKADLLYDMKHKANLAYINAINKAISKDKSLIKNQFNVKFAAEVDSDYNKIITSTFFEKLTPKHIARYDSETIDLIAQNLNGRLTDKVSSDKFQIAIKFFSFIPSIITTIVSVGALYAPHIIIAATFSTAAAAIAGVLALASVVDIFYRHYRQQLFIESMEDLTKKPTPAV